MNRKRFLLLLAVLLTPALVVAGNALTVEGVKYVTQTSVPVSASASRPVVWSDTTTVPNMRYSDGTSNNYVPACVPTTTGDVCSWNTGTGNWQRSSAGGGSGTVTSVVIGTGLSSTQSPLTTTGTLSIANTAVTPGSYTLASITVDQQGRITAASSGAGGGGGATLITDYNLGSVAADQTMLIQSGKGGPVIVKANAGATGALFKVQDSSATNLLSISDNANANLYAPSGSSLFLGGNATGILTLTGTQVSVSGANTASTGAFSIAPTAAASGTQTSFVVSGPSSTNQTLSTEINGVLFDFSATRQWATGAVTTQREFYVKAPTYSFVGASTITTAATLAISGAPLAGTNATITNAYALRVEGGQSQFGGAIVPSADAAIDVGTSFPRMRAAYFIQYAGAMVTPTIAASTTINCANGEAARVVLSATTITTMSMSLGLAGEVCTVEIIQDVTGGRAVPTTWTNVLFAGGSYTATATASRRDVLTFRYDSTDTKWVEMSRSMNLF